MSEVAILEAFTELPDCRCSIGQRHTQALCQAKLILAITAGKKGLLAIGDWLKAYKDELVVLFQPPKSRLPSYSTIRCVLLRLDYDIYVSETTFDFQLSKTRFILVDMQRINQGFSFKREGLTPITVTLLQIPLIVGLKSPQLNQVQN